MGVRCCNIWVYTKGVHLRQRVYAGLHKGCTRVYTKAVRGYDFFLALALLALLALALLALALALALLALALLALALSSTSLPSVSLPIPHTQRFRD
jgi:hypothetical protein